MKKIYPLMNRWGQTIALTWQENIYTGTKGAILQAVDFTKSRDTSSVALEIPLSYQDLKELRNHCEAMLAHIEGETTSEEREKDI